MSENASKFKDTIGFWLQAICALILVKTVGFFGAIASFVSYFFLKPKLGMLGALVCSVIIGVAVGVGVTTLILQNTSTPNIQTSQIPEKSIPDKQIISDPNIQASAMPDEKISVQHVGNFSISYASPFLINEQESLKFTSAAENQTPRIFQSISSYTSSPSCGLGEVRLIVGTYAEGTNVNIDGAAIGSVNQVSTLSGVTSPENTINPTTVSGKPARKISYRARRWGGVLGGEFLVIVDPLTNTFWQLQLIFSARSTNDYSALNSAQLCSQKILESVAILGASPGTTLASVSTPNFSEGAGLPKFEDYPSGPIYQGPAAPLGDRAGTHEDYIAANAKALKENPVVSASEYVISTDDCGAGCKIQFVLSKRTGNVIEAFTTQKIKEVRPNSKLVVTVGPDDESESGDFYTYFSILENGKFNRIAKVRATLPECDGNSSCLMDYPN